MWERVMEMEMPRKRRRGKPVRRWMDITEETERI